MQKKYVNKSYTVFITIVWCAVSEIMYLLICYGLSVSAQKDKNDKILIKNNTHTNLNEFFKIYVSYEIKCLI